jgi:3-isopropylmalate dehydratase small subunit
MQAFTTLDSLVVPLDRANVDTDAIIPKQFMKSIRRTGFGPYLFDEWRYLDHGEPGMDCASRPLNPDFALNLPRYRGAKILLARENFGCGSSREHAVWALDGYGIRALIAPSFADIFYGNCLRNAILPVVLEAVVVNALFRAVQNTRGYALRIDLPAQTVAMPSGEIFGFEIDTFRKDCLLRRLDDIELTLQHAGEITSYESGRSREEPWIFESRAIERPRSLKG